jgi:excisionase family DNA binding protein
MHGDTCVEETMRALTPITLPARLAENAPGSDKPFGFDERLYTAQEVASRLGVSERWVRDHATRRSPRIRAVKLGPLVRFRWPDVQAFLAELAAKNDSKRR